MERKKKRVGGGRLRLATTVEVVHQTELEELKKRVSALEEAVHATQIKAKASEGAV